MQNVALLHYHEDDWFNVDFPTWILWEVDKKIDVYDTTKILIGLYIETASTQRVPNPACIGCSGGEWRGVQA